MADGGQSNDLVKVVGYTYSSAPFLLKLMSRTTDDHLIFAIFSLASFIASLRIYIKRHENER
jgi:hypothetical protein